MLRDPAFISAVIGGLIVAVATLIATWVALKHSRTADAEHRSSLLRGVLRGIQTELNAMKVAYVEEMKTGPYSEWHILPVDYFTVYETNCSFIGQIEEDDLRDSIITAYLAARTLINAHIHNNLLHDKCKQARGNEDMLREACEELEAYRSSLDLARDRALDIVDRCQELLEESELLRPSSKRLLKK